MPTHVSIGLPVYNGEPFLRQALDSLLSQTYSNFELVISDNASTDGTADICTAYAARDPRIRYYRNTENIGVDRNFNRTFELSRNEYFRWAAADDLCASTLLQRCVELLDARQDVVLCYPKARYVDENGGFLRDYEDRLHIEHKAPNDRFATYLRNIDMCNAAFGMIRASVLRQTKLYGAYSDSDLVFLGELTLYGCFFELPETLFCRRIHSGMAVKKYPNAHQRMVMSKPELAEKLCFPHWEVFAGFLSAIHRAPLSWSERLLCYARMNIWLSRRGDGLVTDLKVGVKHLVGKLLYRRRQNRPGTDASSLPGAERER